MICMSKKYKARPSDLIGLCDDYQRFCFDEACIYLMTALDEGKQLKFDAEITENKLQTHYSSVSEYYKSLGVM